MTRSTAAIRLGSMRNRRRTFEVLAREIGTSPRTLSAWAHGQRKPSKAARARIESTLGIPAAEWDAGTEAPARTSRERRSVHGIGPALAEFTPLLDRVDDVLDSCTLQSTKRSAQYLRECLLNTARNYRRKIERLEGLEVDALEGGGPAR